MDAIVEISGDEKLHWFRGMVVQSPREVIYCSRTKKAVNERPVYTSNPYEQRYRSI
jgi:hypothetical protein